MNFFIYFILFMGLKVLFILVNRINGRGKYNLLEKHTTRFKKCNFEFSFVMIFTKKISPKLI